MLITEQRKIDRYYQALLERDPEYLGVFYVGVKTTAIFCISTCRARKPKAENVEFFTHYKEAMDHGYRPCKVCRPTENAHQAPDFVQTAIAQVRENPKQKINDFQLVQQGINPEAVRRWFNKNYGMTFQQFQRMYRINCALEELKSGKNVTDSVLESGYDSLSGFAYTCNKIAGRSLKKLAQQNVLLLQRIHTPLGPMFVCASEQGVVLVEFVDRRMLETEFRDLQRLWQAQILTGENVHTRLAEQQLTEYFAGTRQQFTVPLDARGTEFQQQVWQLLQTIPYGQTVSYQQQAERLQRPEAVRAVASANGHNRIAIIVPCHRVIGKNGQLTGYGGGLERKKWLLQHEQARFNQGV